MLLLVSDRKTGQEVPSHSWQGSRTSVWKGFLVTCNFPSLVPTIHRWGLWARSSQAPVCAAQAVRELDVSSLDLCLRGLMVAGWPEPLSAQHLLVQVFVFHSFTGLPYLLFLYLPFASSNCKCFLGPQEQSTKNNLSMCIRNQPLELAVYPKPASLFIYM